MHVRFLAAVLGFALTAAAAEATPSAQAAFVERRGLLEADAQCHLFTPAMRAALQAGAGQARGALLRSGWTRAQLDQLEQAAAGSARTRDCADPRTLQAATQVRASFPSWSRMSTMSFPGWERGWSARRFSDANGWRLTQDIPSPIPAQFGVRDHGRAQRLTLAIPLTPGLAQPSTAQIIVRDRTRTNSALLELRGRTATGLEAGAPSSAAALHFLASARRIETPDRRHSLLVFEFPDNAFQALLGLDPRETAILLVQQGAQTQRLLVEVGDIAAARTFLAIEG